MTQGQTKQAHTTTRRALLLGVGIFEDARLSQLRSPSVDIDALGRVLADPNIGDFEVRQLINSSSAVMMEAIEHLLADSRPDNLLLLYISSHGIKDETGQLYFATTNTSLDRLNSTSVSAKFISGLMDITRARHLVVILDACYSGKFSSDMRAKAGPAIDILDQLGGRGRVILTSSGTMEYAFEGDNLLTGTESDTSIFTSAIIRGLETGEADQDSDGYITVDELYDYIYTAVRSITPNQTPMRLSSTEGAIVIAKAPHVPWPTNAATIDTVRDPNVDVFDGSTPVALAIPEFNISARAVSDLPSPIDRLGFRPLVDGLEKLLNDPATTLPLAITITAPWGAGKSSTMLQLKNRLQELNHGAPSRVWYVVEFPAWKYENGEKLWAALAKSIYEQPQTQMSRLDRIKFKVKLERSRQSLTSFVLKGLGPPLVALILLSIAIVGDIAKSSVGGSASLIGATALVLASTATTVGRYWGIIGDPFKRAIEKHTERYQYQQQLGFTAEADNDIRCLTHVLLEQEERALAVFVDDLDRCTGRHVVEVVEAVNQIFNSAENRACAFLLGMDSSVVAASIDVAYEDTVRILRERNNPLGRDFGVNFLAKVAQMMVSVATPDPRAIRRYLEGVTGNTAPEGLEETPLEEEVQELEEMIEKRKPQNPVDVFAIGQNLISPEEGDKRKRALNEAVRRGQAKRFNADSHDVAKAEFEVLSCLERNPRQVKRFDNAFRLQLYVASSTPGAVLDFNIDQLVALGRWVALRLRWPHVAKAIDDDPSLLERLERYANEAEGENLDSMESELTSLVGDPRAFKVFREPNEARQMSKLPFGTFLRVT